MTRYHFRVANFLDLCNLLKFPLLCDIHNSVARGYGWKEMVRRFGFTMLNAAVEKAQYPGLDLSPLQWAPPAKSRHRDR
jgi:hypothetical protein